MFWNIIKITAILLAIMIAIIMLLYGVTAVAATIISSKSQGFDKYYERNCNNPPADTAGNGCPDGDPVPETEEAPREKQS